MKVGKNFVKAESAQNACGMSAKKRSVLADFFSVFLCNIRRGTLPKIKSCVALYECDVVCAVGNDKRELS